MEYRITDLMDLAKLQKITEACHLSTGLSTTLVDMDGTILAGSGGQEICSRFHRVNAKTARHCLKNPAGIAEQYKVNNSGMLYKCPNGLYDAAAPVVVAEQQIASLFAGQFLMVRPDIRAIEHFSSQARIAGFNETEYLNALEKVPTLTPAQIEDILDFLKNFAGILSGMGMFWKNRRDGSGWMPDAKAASMPFIQEAADQKGAGAVEDGLAAAVPYTPAQNHLPGKGKHAPEMRCGAALNMEFAAGAPAVSGMPSLKIASDFNDILSAITGYTELLMVGAEKGSCFENGLLKINAAGNRAKSLLRQLVSHTE